MQAPPRRGLRYSYPRARPPCRPRRLRATVGGGRALAPPWWAGARTPPPSPWWAGARTPPPLLLGGPGRGRLRPLLGGPGRGRLRPLLGGPGRGRLRPLLGGPGRGRLRPWHDGRGNIVHGPQSGPARLFSPPSLRYGGAPTQRMRHSAGPGSQVGRLPCKGRRQIPPPAEAAGPLHGTGPRDRLAAHPWPYRSAPWPCPSSFGPLLAPTPL